MGKQIQIILTKDQPKLGHKGNIVSVALGYARNFLLPQGIAILATAENLKGLEAKKQVQLEEHQLLIESQKPILEKIVKTPIRLTAKAQESGSLFGSITEKEIAETISRQFGINFSEHNIKLDKPLKKTGEHEVTIVIAPELSAEIKVVIEAEED